MQISIHRTVWPRDCLIRRIANVAARCRILATLFQLHQDLWSLWILTTHTELTTVTIITGTLAYIIQQSIYGVCRTF